MENQNESSKTSVVGTIIAAPFVAMAAIPIVMGAVIFAPVTIPLAILCTSLKDRQNS